MDIDISKWINDWLHDFFSGIASQLSNMAIHLLADYITSITDLNKIPKIWDIIKWAQMGAQVLATIFLVYRLFMALRDIATGEADPNYAEIIGSYFLSFALIFALPHLITHFFLPVNNAIIQSIADLGIVINMPRTNPVDLVTMPIIGLGKDLVVTAIVAMVWGFAFVILTIAGVIRYAEIAIMLVICPLVATSYVNRSDILRVFFIEATSVVFTQPIHFLITYWIASSITKGLWGVLFSIGLVVVATRGPQVLKQFIYSSGAAGITTRTIGGTSRFAIYKLMMLGGAMPK